MVAAPPKVVFIFVLLANLGVQRILAAFYCFTPTRLIRHPRGFFFLCNDYRLCDNVFYLDHPFFVQLLVYLTGETRYAACSAKGFNKAALDGTLYLFLSGRFHTCLQRQTEEDLGVISNDPSVHASSLQSCQTISHAQGIYLFAQSIYTGVAFT